MDSQDLPPFEKFLKQLKVNLWALGIPYGESKIQFRFYVLMFPLFPMLGGEIAYFVSKISLENFLELTQLAPCICIGLLSLLKIASVCMNRNKIFELSISLNKLYDQILSDKNKKQLVKYEMGLLDILMKYFFVLNLVLINVYNFSALGLIVYHFIETNEMQFQLPYFVLLPFSTDAWIPWAGVYTYSVLCGFLCVLFYTTVDGLYFVLTSHVCVNFRVISDKIGNLTPKNIDNLGEIVSCHQYILKLGEDLEDIFTLPNLFNVLVGSLEICALGFNLTTGSWDQIPGSVLFITSVLLQILMMSVFGENIIRESANIGDAAYFCDWYKMDSKSKKKILTIMLRAHKPQRLTAYKFSTISYASFTKIISTSWSYFTILRTVYTPPTGSSVE